MKSEKNRVTDISEYLKRRIAEACFARLIGEIVVILGVIGSSIALLFRILGVAILGFSLLFAGLYLSVHYELQRLDYTEDLEKFMHT
ncbi:MAG: hypothetical protein JSV35_04385 [Candidatus Bathyarchaeota archaeon]|nr:MAG: hypothetical protein JSV35_04385 [Candidatus Bathyarchaeota archaeon]